jgi:prefoldin subunit 5
MLKERIMNYDRIEELAHEAQYFSIQLEDITREQAKLAASPNPHPDWAERLQSRKESIRMQLAGIREEMRELVNEGFNLETTSGSE